MKNGYQLLVLLQDKLNGADSILTTLTSISKSEFAKDENRIMIGIGILNEIKEITYSLDEEVFVLNNNLYNLLMPIAKYADNMFNQYKFVNAYKLYDVIKLNVPVLKQFLNKIKR